MAREKHLTAVHIGNFKRFSDFRVENLGQFNLVVGDNNTGKTSFLEALVVDENGAIWMTNLNSLIRTRTTHKCKDDLKFFTEHYNLLLNSDNNHEKVEVTLELEGKIDSYTLHKFDLERDIVKLTGLVRERILLQNNNKGFVFTKNEEVVVINDNESIDQATMDMGNFIPFIPFGLGYDLSLEKFFTNNIDNNVERRDKFIERLKVFIPEVQDVRIGQEVINIFEKGRNTPKPLHSFGEGSNKFFRILCEIVICEGKRLMIDEIDAGIHHTKFVRFWKAIMQAATEYDVQIFATTHNEECLTYFRLALEAEEMAAQRAHARVITLKLRKENKVRAKVYDFANLQIATELNHEIRGGGL